MRVMNENLNLVEILKNCPKGMELDCTMFDNATFDGITENRLYPIKVNVGDGPTISLTKYGQYTDDDYAKCIIFPKGETTWEGFVPPHKFKDGDIVTICSASQIFILQKAISDKLGYCYTGYDFKRNEFFVPGRWAFNRLATEEEKQKLFQAIKDKGYKWNAETKTLERLVEHKFDPKTLEPFDRVLVKVDSYWSIELFSNMYEYMGDIYYACARGSYKECIPYNDETKHLLCTSDEAPEYYRYWED